MVAELISIRIFPWQFGHTQLAFTYLAQAAAIGGTLLLSFILFYLAENLINYKNTSKFASYLAILTLPVLLTLGYIKAANSFIYQYYFPEQEVAIVQANIATEKKHNIKYFVTNKYSYLKLTKEIDEGSDLFVVWPESVLMDWIYDKVKNIKTILDSQI